MNLQALLATPTETLVECIEIMNGALHSEPGSAEILEARDAAAKELVRRFDAGDPIARETIKKLEEQKKQREQGGQD